MSAWRKFIAWEQAGADHGETSYDHEDHGKTHPFASGQRLTQPQRQGHDPQTGGNCSQLPQPAKASQSVETVRIREGPFGLDEEEGEIQAELDWEQHHDQKAERLRPHETSGRMGGRTHHSNQDTETGSQGNESTHPFHT